MGDRFSAKRSFLPVLLVAGLAGLQMAGRTQGQDRRSGPDGRTKETAGAESRSEDPSLRRLAAALCRYRLGGDAESAARVFAEMFRPDPADDPATALKSAPGGQGRNPLGAPAKDLPAADGTSPVFFSVEDERSPAAELWTSSGGESRLVSAAEQWAGGQAGPIGLRTSADGGRSWTGTTTLGDDRPWTQPVLRQISAQAMGLAFVREWSAADGDVYLARFTGGLTCEGEFPIACGPSDERNPSLASDGQAFPSPYLYAVYAERDGARRTVRFRISPDLGTSWSRPASIASFAGPDGPALETALAYDPDRNMLHAAFTCPQGSSTGIAVSSSRDFGASWSRPALVTTSDGLADRTPRIAAARGRVVIVYEHATPGGGSAIGLASSSTAGLSFTSGERLASTAAGERFPDLRTGPEAAPAKFFASYVEGGTRLVVLSRDVAGSGSWTTEMTLETGRPIPSGPVALVPVPSADPGGTAGVLWTDRDPDADVLFGSIHILADALLVTPANRDVPYTAGTTTFAVDISGGGSISWTAEVTTGSDWLSIAAGASGTDAGTITVDYDENPYALERGGTIRISATDGSVPAVSVTVTQAAAPGLEVTPDEGFTSSGPEGGPFVPASKSYTLSNPGGAPVSWAASESRNWLQLSLTSGVLDPGTSIVVTASFTRFAENLSPGEHAATVTFTNRDNGLGSTTRDVLLTVTGPAGPLEVTPADGMASSGFVGGPFTPSSQAYTLRNSGSSSIGWTAAKTTAWTSLSASSGTLSAGASLTVTVSINAAAGSLGAGFYEDAVTFTNTTNGTGTTTRPVTLTVSTPPGVLAVTPAGGLVSTGPEGGPFTPSSETYTLENTGASALSWTASKTQNWTTLSAASGLLGVGETATVTVSINAAAGTLAVGEHTDTISFVNGSGGGGSTTRSVALTVLRGPALAVTPAHRDVPFIGAVTTFAVDNTGAGTMTWSAAVISGSDWLTIDSGAVGTDAGTITVTAAANRTSVERTGTIRVTALGASGSPANVTVSQVKGSLALGLSGQRLVERAWIIQREFARLTVAVDNPAAVPVETFVLYRRSGGGGEQIVQQVDGGAVTGETLVINDAFIDPGTTYVYRVAALDVFGNTLAVSNEVTLE